jgi:large subunit ribosomal protein L6
VKVEITDHLVKVSGPKGELSASLHRDLTVEMKDKQLIVSRHSEDKQHKASWFVEGSGAKHGFRRDPGATPKKLELVGVGYRRNEGEKASASCGILASHSLCAA